MRRYRRLLIAGALASVMTAFGAAALLGAMPIGKAGLPVFPTQVDDGRPLPIPSTGPVIGPAYPAEQAAVLPADLLEVAAPARPNTDGGSLSAYRRDRLAVLAGLPKESSVAARVTFRTSLPPAEALALLTGQGFTVMYVEFVVPGATDHGGFVISHLDQNLAAHPDLQVVHVAGWGPTSGLATLAANSSVWLVDPAGQQNFYWAAQRTGILAP
jgi:hypothetical protein